MTHRAVLATLVGVSLIAGSTAVDGVHGMRPQVARRVAAFDGARMARIADLVGEAIADGQTPGAVVMVGRGDEVGYRQAFGNRAVEPAVEPMTLDTIFDLASLTKVVATTTAVMMLVEEGRLRLSDTVATHVPGFERYGKEGITVRHLLTHVSGLRPDLDLSVEFAGYDEAIARAIEEVPTSPPGERLVYSDINFLLLGEIVRRVSGMPLDRFCATRIFEPLGMHDTMFKPPASLMRRIAPTERCTPYGWPCEQAGAAILRGVVHDPTARRMLGVAGHAGLFSTASDLGVFCRMLLNGGRSGPVRILSPLSVAKMTSPVDLPGGQQRGLGWDVDSAYSSNRGELIPLGSFGHTGWTGTSLWIDPTTRTWIVFLSNRVHPDGKGNVTPLRARIATVVGSAILSPPMDAVRAARSTGGDFGTSSAATRVAPSEPVSSGIDVLRADGFKLLQGRRIGLVTNHTGAAATGESTIDLLATAPGVRLVALFSPEHGIRGGADEAVASSRDQKTGLPIHSLYGATDRPTSQMLDGIDTLVIDIADVGVRFYTYETTMAYVMEEAARRRIRVVVLDRVNPINGFSIEGPTLDRSLLGFVGYFPMPVRHGMTMGELARLFNAENRIDADLTVVPLKNWRREAWFDETGVTWISPSPNMRTLNAATLYPGVCLIEATNVSVGRGTDTPFEHIGAPWMDGRKLAATLNDRRIPGIRFYPTSFTPTESRFKDEACSGVFMVVTDRKTLQPVRMGVELASAIYKQHGSAFDIDKMLRLLGSASALQRIKSGEDPAQVASAWENDEARWRLLRAKYLLYQ